MILNKVIIVIAFITSILIISSSQISFATKNDKEKDDGEDLKDAKDDKINKVQNDILNDHYPNQYYACGYPQQLITDYNFFEKLNCD